MAEMLIALAGFLIISTVCLTLAVPVHQMAKRESFFTILKADLYYAQMYSISHQTEVTLTFMETENNYYAYDVFDKSRLAARSYQNDLKVVPGSMPLTFRFQPDGNVSRFGSFFILADGRRFRMTLLIGRGRFYIVEE